MMFISLSASAGVADLRCTGKFINPITDMCWSCVMPIGISNLWYKGKQDGTKDLKGIQKYACTCDLFVGVPISYYEPARLMDVTTKPYCMVGLGGVDFGDTGAFRGDSEGIVSDPNTADNYTFLQTHYYINPVMYVMGLILDSSKCFEQDGFDVAYISEVDPSWIMPEFANLLSPDSFLYGTLPAVLACTGDCVAATAGFGIAPLHWCVGCSGLMYPMTGSIAGSTSTIDSASIIMLRMLNKLHRQAINLSYYGNKGLCGGYRQILMNKRQYKYSMLYPVGQNKSIAKALSSAIASGQSATGNTSGEVPDTAGLADIDGKGGRQCCQPFGRTTLKWGVGRYYPVKGEDMSYQIYRKRDCCQFVAGIQ